MAIGHDATINLVATVNGALALVSLPFVLYEVFTKHPAITQMKEKLDQRRSQLLRLVVSDLAEKLRPYLPETTGRIVVEPIYREDRPPNLSEDAMDEMQACLESNEKALSAAIKLRGFASRVLRLDRIGYWLIFATAVESIGALITWFLYRSMSDRIAICLLATPILTASVALICAGIRQSLIHVAQHMLVTPD